MTATDRYDLWESPTLRAAADWAFGSPDEPTDVHRGDCLIWTSDDPCDCGAGHA